MYRPGASDAVADLNALDALADRHDLTRRAVAAPTGERRDIAGDGADVGIAHEIGTLGAGADARSGQLDNDLTGRRLGHRAIDPLGNTGGGKKNSFVRHNLVLLFNAAQSIAVYSIQE